MFCVKPVSHIQDKALPTVARHKHWPNVDIVLAKVARQYANEALFWQSWGHVQDIAATVGAMSGTCPRHVGDVQDMSPTFPRHCQDKTNFNKILLLYSKKCLVSVPNMSQRCLSMSGRCWGRVPDMSPTMSRQKNILKPLRRVLAHSCLCYDFSPILTRYRQDSRVLNFAHVTHQMDSKYNFQLGGAY